MKENFINKKYHLTDTKIHQLVQNIIYLILFQELLFFNY